VRFFRIPRLHSWRPLPLSNSLFPMFAGSGLDADVEPSASPSSPFEEEPPFEEQLLPPRKNVAEIAASTLPEHAKISAEVMWLLQQASCEFCSFVMSEAVSNIPDQTVRAGHILAAMRNLSARHACPCLSCCIIPKCSRVAGTPPT
jgi:histone H3/H4